MIEFFILCILLANSILLIFCLLNKKAKQSEDETEVKQYGNFVKSVGIDNDHTIRDFADYMEKREKILKC